MQFVCPLGFREFFYRAISNHLGYLEPFGYGIAVKLWEEKDISLN